MGAVAVLNAERIKLSTTRSPLWSAVAVAALSLGLAAMQASTVYASTPLAPDKAAMGVAVFGVPVLMILSALTVTGEYRSGMIRTTFMAAPNRTLVLAAKAVVAAAFSSFFAAVMTVVSIVVARWWPSRSSTRSCRSTALDLASGRRDRGVRGARRGSWRRRRVHCCEPPAGAVALLLLWPLVAEPMLGNLPDISPVVGPYLPFGNAFRFIGVQWLYPDYAMPWGELGSIRVLRGRRAAAVFVAALVTVNRTRRMTGAAATG